MKLHARYRIFAALLFAVFTGTSADAGDSKLNFEKIEKGVVKIEHSIYGVPTGFGSGFFVSKYGFILTNRHVLAPYFEGLPTSRLTVQTRDGQRFVGDQIKFYGCSDIPSLDVCLLKVIDTPKYVFAIRSSPMKKGQKVFEIGHPLNLEWSLSNGIVSGYQNVEPESFAVASVSARRVEVLQTTAPSSPGNSGGPVFDEDGKVVGMMTFGYTENSAQNLNFAISSGELNTFYKQKSSGKEMVLSQLRKESLEKDAANSKKLYEDAIKPAALNPIPWEVKKFSFGSELYEMNVPKASCGDPAPNNNPNHLAFGCKVIKGDAIGVRFVEVEANIIDADGKIVQKPIEYPFYTKIKSSSRWAQLKTQITPEQEKFMSSVPGITKCARPGWSNDPVGKWTLCRASIYNYPTLGASTQVIQLQKPGTKYSVIFLAQVLSDSRSALTNGIAEAMMHSIHKSDQSVPIRSLASLDQAGLSQAQVISAVRKKQSGIDECYDRASARRPGIDGHAEFIFSIAPSGQLTDVQIGQSTLPKHTGLQNCVKDVLRQTKFSPSGKGTTSMIDLPFKPKMVP